MKSALLLAALLLVVAAPAMAGGVNFNWGSVCWPEAQVDVKTFACDVNTSTAAYQWPMTLSWRIDTDMPDLVGIEITLMGQTSLATLPDWWKVGASPDCRANQLLYTSDKTAVETGPGGCADWTAGTAFNLFGYIYQADPRLVQVNGGCAIDASLPVLAIAGQEYYGGQFLLKNTKTVGTGSCSGCASPFIMGVSLVTVAGLDGRRDDLADALPGGNQCLYWNTQPDVVLYCFPIQPARNTTWGQVKSLYR